MGPPSRDSRVRPDRMTPHYITMKQATVIHCWSAPRSRSTALLYSFEARNDCVAIDEPLYREWLIRKGSAVQRPYTEHLIHGTAPDGADEGVWKREQSCLDERILQATQSSDENIVIFCKHMAKHCNLYDFDNQVQSDSVKLIHRHLLLIRDPVAVLSSWKVSDNVHGSNVTPQEVGIVSLLPIYNSVHGVLLDSDELIQDPAAVLARTCQELEIPYTDEMLSWKPGPHACDGPWAKWWYENVHKSSSWNTQQEKIRYRTIHPSLYKALEASVAVHTYLIQQTARYKARGPPPEKIYEDPRNEHLLVYIGTPGRGRLLPRQAAGLSPWDSSVQGGDGTWEGLRVYRGKILSLEPHLRRLFKSAKALGYENMHTKDEVKEAIFQTLAANGMRDGAHMRLTLTRGEKCTSSMNPVFNVYATTLIVLPEWKPTEGATTYDNTAGIDLITASQRRNSPSTLDSKIHHNNMLNNILPKMQANLAGCADAIMLDLDGFVSETNATNIFLVDNGILMTPHGDHCLPGITRATVLELAKEVGIPTEVRRISLSEFHSADEVFTTGTMGELTPVRQIDGRIIGSGSRGPITERLQDVYRTLPDREGWATPIPEFE